MHTQTDTRIRAIGASPKTQRLFDGGGLCLEVCPAGGKWWRLKYRLHGIEKRLSLGTHPTVPLKSARDRAAQARKLLADGGDPSAERQALKQSRGDAQGNSFEPIAREWHTTIHKPAVSAQPCASLAASSETSSRGSGSS